MDANRVCSTQFIINNLPEDQREHLMKKDVREEICKYADVSIAIRGRYYGPKDDVCNVEKNRLLHLHITGPTKDNLSQATSKIDTLLGRNTDSKPINNAEESFVEEKITVGVELFPSIFRMKSKILGENEENVKYIALETKAEISLRGKGSGNTESSDEPLHIFVTYKDPASHDDAQKLILNLIETVQQDFIEAYGKYYPVPKKPEIIVVKPKAKTKSVSPPKEEPKKIVKPVSTAPAPVHDTEKISLGFNHVPIKFNLKSKIYGPNLSNVKHIEKVSSAVLLVEGVNSGFSSDKVNPNEAPFILVKYLKPEMKEMARGLILNLIETIHQEFTNLYGAYLPKPRKPEILPLKSTPKFPKPSAPENFPKPPKMTSPVNVRKPMRRGSIPERSLSPDIGPVPPPPPVISKGLSPHSAKSTLNDSVNGAENNRKSVKEIKPIRITFPKANPPKTVPPPNALFKEHNIEVEDDDMFEDKPSIQNNSKSLGASNTPLNENNKQKISSYSLQNTKPQIIPIETLNVRPEITSHRSQNVQSENKYYSLNANQSNASFTGSNVNPQNVSYTNHSFESPNMAYPSKTTAQHSVSYPLQTIQTQNISFTPRYVQPIPSIVPPIAQPILDKPNYTPATSNFLSHSEIKPLIEDNMQYFKKRSNSPVEMHHQENKRFCANADDAGNMSGQISSIAIQREQISLKTKVTSNRYLVPLQKVDSLASKQSFAVGSQVGGAKKPLADSEAVLSFLNECAKASTKVAGMIKSYDKESDDEDGKSVIVIDSEEEPFENDRMSRMSKNSISANTRTVGVQTIGSLRETCVKCACGRFSRSLTGIRTVGIQTPRNMA